MKPAGFLIGTSEQGRATKIQGDRLKASHCGWQWLCLGGKNVFSPQLWNNQVLLWVLYKALSGRCTLKFPALYKAPFLLWDWVQQEGPPVFERTGQMILPMGGVTQDEITGETKVAWVVQLSVHLSPRQGPPREMLLWRSQLCTALRSPCGTKLSRAWPMGVKGQMIQKVSRGTTRAKG